MLHVSGYDHSGLLQGYRDQPFYIHDIGDVTPAVANVNS
jgi:hypothetical protein